MSGRTQRLRSVTLAERFAYLHRGYADHTAHGGSDIDAARAPGTEDAATARRARG